LGGGHGGPPHHRRLTPTPAQTPIKGEGGKA